MIDEDNEDLDWKFNDDKGALFCVFVESFFVDSQSQGLWHFKFGCCVETCLHPGRKWWALSKWICSQLIFELAAAFILEQLHISYARTQGAGDFGDFWMPANVAWPIWIPVTEWLAIWWSVKWSSNIMNHAQMHTLMSQNKWLVLECKSHFLMDDNNDETFHSLLFSDDPLDAPTSVRWATCNT